MPALFLVFRKSYCRNTIGLFCDVLQIFFIKILCGHNLNISKLSYYEEILISADNV